MTIVIVSVLVTAVIVYFATPTLIDMMMDPIRGALPEGTRLTVLTALGGFTIRFKVAIFFGIIICTPIIIWEAMGFFLPALHTNERKWVVPTVAAMVALFFIGMVFCYLIIQRAAFGWLLDQTLDFADVVANAEDFLNIMMLLEVGFGVAFELPHHDGHLHARRVARHDVAHVRRAHRPVRSCACRGAGSRGGARWQGSA